MASELKMVHLKLLHSAARLAAPVVALEDLPVQFAVGFAIEPQSRIFRGQVIHAGLPLISDKNMPC